MEQTPILSQTLTFQVHEDRPQASRRSITSPQLFSILLCIVKPTSLADERGQASSPELPLENSFDVSTQHQYQM